MLFQDLLVWRDPTARTGPENMAIDEWLMSQVGEIPILRFYHWEGDWVSLGYFQSLEAAREDIRAQTAICPSLDRRRGGGSSE